MEAALKALKGFRKQKDLTQRQLGEMLNVAPSTIAMWERGEREPKCTDLKRLADVLEVSVDNLLSHKVYEQRPPLSEMEENFVNGFKKLNQTHQEIVLSTMRAFLTQQAASVFGSLINNNNGNLFVNRGDVYDYVTW